MKIAFKLPMAEELAAALRNMSDKDAGAAFKAALTYQTGGAIPALPPAAQLAFVAMRELIDLSRMKAAAGRAGGRSKHFSGRKQAFAGSSAGNSGGSIADGTAANNAGNTNESAYAIDVLAGLEAFM